MRERFPPASRRRKARLALRVWVAFADVTLRLKRGPLPVVVASLTVASASDRPREHPRLLSRAVDRALRVGRRQPTCLVNALVLFRLLAQQGDRPVLVIGLKPDAADYAAHAWIELGGVDVGPAPGRMGHVEIARYP